MDGLQSILRAPDIHLVGSVSTAEEAVVRARDLRPDVVLMDARLQGVDLKEATRLIKERSPGARVLFMLVHHEDIDIATEAGADGHGYSQALGGNRAPHADPASAAYADTRFGPA